MESSAVVQLHSDPSAAPPDSATAAAASSSNTVAATASNRKKQTAKRLLFTSFAAANVNLSTCSSILIRWEVEACSSIPEDAVTANYEISLPFADSCKRVEGLESIVQAAERASLLRYGQMF